ncbi:uncharacterized protein LOC113282315 [Papaver somniferum]|uniref:uncharacterized protein LOC113282315 n=1 Tax=Papaver somniferum TaxID=3469 RepID=UPI000E6F4AA5|nr:uncharacterized protein LOC113282315 [Papaver somniferum]
MMRFLRYGTRPLLERGIRREVEALERRIRKTIMVFVSLSEEATLHDQQTTQTFLGPPDAYLSILSVPSTFTIQRCGSPVLHATVKQVAYKIGLEEEERHQRGLEVAREKIQVTSLASSKCQQYRSQGI